MNYHILFKYNFMQMVCPKLHWQLGFSDLVSTTQHNQYSPRDNTKP
jgi:hypothetical protein